MPPVSQCFPIMKEVNGVLSAAYFFQLENKVNKECSTTSNCGHFITSSQLLLGRAGEKVFVFLAPGLGKNQKCQYPNDICVQIFIAKWVRSTGPFLIHALFSYCFPNAFCSSQSPNTSAELLRENAWCEGLYRV